MSRITSHNNYESNLSSSLLPIIECNTRGQLPENAVDPKVKVSVSRKQIMASSILPKNERNSLRSTFSTQDSECCSLFGRIEDTNFFFRDLMTFFNDARVKYYDSATA